jgi:cytochrome P450
VVESPTAVGRYRDRVSSELDVSAFDPGDAAFQQDPYPVLNALREATPMFRNERTGQWTVTRFDLVHALLRDRRLGRNYTHLATHEQMGRPAPDPRWADFAASEEFSLLNLEPPDHTRIRLLLAKVFTPSSVATMRPHLDEVSVSLLRSATERDDIDLLRDYAMPYSIDVICTLLGVPVSDGTQLLRWSHAIVKMYELSTTDAQRVEANAAGRDFIVYTRALIAKKRAKPDGTLVSDLVQVEEAGDRLTEDEIVSTVIVLLNAGHEATVNVHGNGMRAFFRFPDEWARVKSGDVTTRSAAEEMTRWDAPLQLFERFVLARDGIEVSGQHLPFGSEIAMLFGAANRDPRRFVDADRFDASRNDTGHIGFGGGIHFCIGAPLARLELEASLDHLREHNIDLVAEPVYAPTFVLHGLKELRVKVSR